MQGGNEKTVYAKIAEGIYVGNAASAADIQFLADAEITAIVNLSGRADMNVEDVDIFDYMLPSQELMEVEFPKTFAKLEIISQDIHAARINQRSVLIHCGDGKNKCMLAAGYYLITHCGKKYDAVIDQLETLYFSAQQKHDDQEDQGRMAVDPEEYLQPDIKLTEIERKATEDVRKELEEKRAARRAIRCLTMSSFRKMLRLHGGAKR